MSSLRCMRGMLHVYVCGVGFPTCAYPCIESKSCNSATASSFSVSESSSDSPSDNEPSFLLRNSGSAIWLIVPGLATDFTFTSRIDPRSQSQSMRQLIAAASNNPPITEIDSICLASDGSRIRVWLQREWMQMGRAYEKSPARLDNTHACKH